MRARRASRQWLGDDEAVKAAYAAHGGELYRFARRSLGDGGAAEEAVQETFLRAWRHADRFDPDVASMRAWLFAIARNVVIDMLRARAVRPMQPSTDLEALMGSTADPADDLLRTWQVEEALSRLSPEHRTALVETYYRQRPHEEVAAAIGIPKGTLRSRVFYGLKALRVALEELGWGHDG